MTCEAHNSTAAAAADTEPVCGLWLESRRRDLLAALTVAADRADLDCVDCAEDTCADPDHRATADTVRRWRGLAQKLATPPPAGTQPGVVAYHPDAARRWLSEWAGDELGIDESFNTVEATIAAGLEGLLQALAHNAQPHVWATREPLDSVRLWRTADGDGVDGGAVITAGLRLGDHLIRLATTHQGFDEFVTDEATSGPDAAVEALGHLAELVNRTVARLWTATAVRPPDSYTVIGGWDEDEPVPVGVVAGDHHVYDGDQTAFTRGLWATSVTAPDSATAQQRAVDQMRQELTAEHYRVDAREQATSHDCRAAGTLEFVATYGAPGVGQAWRCSACGREWSRVGDHFYPAADGTHILSPEETR